MSSLIEYLGGFDPLLNFYNSYDVFLYTALFAYFFVKSKNRLAIIIVGESIFGYMLNNYFADIHILAITGQFIIYGFTLYLCRSNALIALSYLILLAHFLAQYITNSYYATTGTWTAYNVTALVYYSYYVMLTPILYMMIKGLFIGGGGKGYAHRLHNNNNGSIYNNRQLFNNFKLRLKTDIQKRFERVKKT